MAFRIRLHNITAPNPFYLYYKTGPIIGSPNSGFIKYNGGSDGIGGLYHPSTTGVTSGVFRNYDTNPITVLGINFDVEYVWFKIYDLVTSGYTIENLYTHDSKFYECYDEINFHISGNTWCCKDYVFNLVDDVVGVTHDGNHSSVIGGTPKSYRIYSGLTHDVTLSTFITTATTDPTTGIIYTVSGTSVTKELIYFFVEHADGNLESDNLSNPKKQGGFEVKSVCLCCDPNPYYTPTPTSTPTPTPSGVPIWVSGDTICETENPFEVLKTITGFSSPSNAWYDDINKLVYVTDLDDVAGNVFWFDPLTATTYSHAIHSTAVTFTDVYTTYIDTDYRRMYFAGKDTGGLIVYDIDTDTKTTSPYGTNGAYRRIGLSVGDNYIYANGGTTPNSVEIMVRTGTTVVSGTTKLYSDIPGGYFGVQLPLIFEIPSGSTKNIWTVGGGGASSTIGDIGIFDLTLTTNISSIVLSGVTTWDGGRYWQSGFYDKEYDKFYVSDYGSNQVFVIDTVSNIVIYNRKITNLETKTNSETYWVLDPTNGRLYEVHNLRNSSIDSTVIAHTYEINRTTYDYLTLYKNIGVTNLTPVSGTNYRIGVSPYIPHWAGGMWNTDGTVTYFSNSINGSNNGLVDVLTLIEENSFTHIPTGNVKPNSPLDPDYIAPFIDYVTCPLTYTTTCPDITQTDTGTKLIYEFSIINTVLENPEINKIRVKANDSSLGVVGTNDYTGYTSNFFNGSFSGLTTGNTHTISVEYLDISNNLLATCI